MATKREILQDVNSDYLREIYLYANNTRISYPSGDREELLHSICRRFTKEELEKINQGFVLNLDPVEVADEIRGCNGKELCEIYIKSIARSYKVFKEVQVRDRICDLVLMDKVSGKLIAIEIKANGDELKRGINQCRDYGQWADYVYLLIEEKRMHEVERLPFKKNGIGLITYENGFETCWKARKNEISKDYLIRSLSTDRLRDLLSRRGLSKAGLKDDLVASVRTHDLPIELLKKALFPSV